LRSPHPEVLLLGGYAAVLVAGAFGLEWLSRLTHRRSHHYRTAGFTYHPGIDAWKCPENEYLWPHELDHRRRVVRYRARASVCNSCARKPQCTDSDEGREVVRPLDPWPHSEAGRFHRGLALVMVALAILILVVEAARHHAPLEVALLALEMGAALAAARWLAADLRAHPAGFPSRPPALPATARRTSSAEPG
jgi:hypothetical protein